LIGIEEAMGRQVGIAYPGQGSSRLVERSFAAGERLALRRGERADGLQFELRAGKFRPDGAAVINLANRQQRPRSIEAAWRLQLLEQERAVRHDGKAAL